MLYTCPAGAMRKAAPFGAAFLIAFAGFLLGSDRAGDRQRADAGTDAVRAGGILGERGGGHRDDARHRGELSGGGIVGVLRRRGQGRPVQRHRQIAEPRVEGIRHHQTVCRLRRGIAGVLDDEGVGQPPVGRYLRGGQGLADSQRRGTPSPWLSRHRAAPRR